MASSSPADDRLFDCLPSIRRPKAWETVSRSRQLTCHSDTDSVHSADESFVRVSSAPGRRSAPGSAGRRPLAEVRSPFWLVVNVINLSSNVYDLKSVFANPLHFMS